MAEGPHAPARFPCQKHSSHPGARGSRARLDTALRRGQIFSSPIVRLELYKGARSRAELDETDQRVRVAEELPMTPEIATLAVDAVKELATEGASGFHQLPVCDVLIAASAAAHHLGVLTGDWRDYELAVVLGSPLFHPLKPSTHYLP
jgi:predicted nucleic acid-binding protein